jgi:hypothetical protein
MLRVNHELSVAITKALIILGYFEGMEEDTPDESIWGHPEKLEEWFETVKERRKNPGASKNNSEWENVDLDQNELTKGLR